MANPEKKGQRGLFVPVFKEGNLDKAVAKCETCDKQLERIRPPKLMFARCEDHPEAKAIVESPGSEMLTAKATISLRPFDFMAAEKDVCPDTRPTADEIIEFCCHGKSFSIERVVSRYHELHRGTLLKGVPSVDFIDEKVIEPLQQAQSSYMMRNFLATIALCGVVGEMLTNLAWKVYKPFVRINGQEVTDQLEVGLFRSRLEDRTQAERMTILLNLNVIQQSSFDKFKRVMHVRNDYIHFMKVTSTVETQKKQAKELFQLVQELACEIIGQDFSQYGQLQLSQGMFDFLRRNDLVDFPIPGQKDKGSGN